MIRKPSADSGKEPPDSRLERWDHLSLVTLTQRDPPERSHVRRPKKGSDGSELLFLAPAPPQSPDFARVVA